jgi:5'-nucleotidase
MKILVTNDDGVGSAGLKALVEELRKVARVTVVAPDREQSAVGTAVSLWRPLRTQKVKPLAPGVETYAVEGTPSDSVILGLAKLVEDRVDMVISGINQGHNLGDDVHISGTVSAALQGYLHGFPSFAISTARENNHHLGAAAKVAAFMAQKITSDSIPANIFLNINLPNLPLAEIGGAKITRLAQESHINTVEERDDSQGKYFQLVRQSLNRTAEEKTDVLAIERGNISITPLATSLSCEPSSPALDNLCTDLFHKLQGVDE